MAHSKHYAKVKYYYEQGYWKKFMVYNIVGKNWITPEEYEEITGEPYVKPQPPVEQEEDEATEDKP